MWLGGSPGSDDCGDMLGVLYKLCCQYEQHFRDCNRVVFCVCVCKQTLHCIRHQTEIGQEKHVVNIFVKLVWHQRIIGDVSHIHTPGRSLPNMDGRNAAEFLNVLFSWTEIHYSSIQDRYSQCVLNHIQYVKYWQPMNSICIVDTRSIVKVFCSGLHVQFYLVTTCSICLKLEFLVIRFLWCFVENRSAYAKHTPNKNLVVI